MKTSRKMELPPLPLVHNPQVTLWVGRHYPVRRPRCTFLRLIKHIFFVIQAFVFSKSCKDLKLLESCNQLLRTSAIVWTHYEFPLVFSHTTNTVRQYMCCGVAAIVLGDSAAYLTGYVSSTDTPKNTITTKNMRAQKRVSKTGQHCPQFFVT